MPVAKLSLASSRYTIFRLIFGLYLFIHFAQLVPWGTELFSDRGVLRDGETSPLLFLFPNILAVLDSPAFVTIFLVVAAGASLLFAAGLCDRAAAVALWYVLACLFGRNPLIGNPSMPFVGILLLAHVCHRRSPKQVVVVVWILMAVSYSYSGYTKLSSPSWIDGTAVEQILNNPLARNGVMRNAVLTLPSVLLVAVSRLVLGLELLFAPLALFRSVRPWLWAAMLSLHLSLIALIDFADLSWGMVMLHLFTGPGQQLKVQSLNLTFTKKPIFEESPQLPARRRTGHRFVG